MPLPKILSSEEQVFPFLTLRKEQLQRVNGQVFSYMSVILPTDAAVVLVENEEKRFLFNQEYRHPVKKTLLGLPGGRLEVKEDPLTGGRRELLEETGFAVKELRLLGSCYPFPGICNQKVSILHAYATQKVQEPTLDPLEIIEPVWLSEEEILSKLEILDGMVPIALWYYQKNLA